MSDKSIFLSPDVVALAMEVIDEHHPAEAVLFESVLAEFKTDPSALLAGKGLRAPVGMGVDLTLMTPYVLAAASFLGGLVAQKVTDAAFDSIRARIEKAWARRRATQPADVESNLDGVADAIADHLVDQKVDPEAARKIAEQVTRALLPLPEVKR